MNELALFTGGGGGLLGSILNGWRTVCAVEIDPYCRDVLSQRQMDGMLDVFHIWDDVRTFDGRPWRGCVDIVTGGFPCQDISAAGKGVGIDGERSGLWSEFARIIGEVGPRFAFVENSPRLTSRGIGRVLGDLAEMGFDAEWGCVSAEDAIWLSGTPAVYHERERIWIVASNRNTNGIQQDQERRVCGGSHAESGRGGESRVCANANCDRRESDNRRGLIHNQERDDQGEEQRWINEQSRSSNVCSREDANADSLREQQSQGRVTDVGRRTGVSGLRRGANGIGARWWLAEPAVGGMVDGLAGELDEPGRD